jgi:hypothetical protein
MKLAAKHSRSFASTQPYMLVNYLLAAYLMCFMCVRNGDVSYCPVTFTSARLCHALRPSLLAFQTEQAGTQCAFLRVSQQAADSS